jgi:hypothetical protein
MAVLSDRLNVCLTTEKKMSAGTDFMSNAYARIGEPLNLQVGGQKWFRSVRNSQKIEQNSASLLLGATPWLTRLLSRKHQRVFVVDSSSQMLTMLQKTVSGLERRTHVETIHSNWLHLPHFPERICLVVGDNAFSFLPFPGGWNDLCNKLAARMQPNAILMIRVLSVPAWHVASSVEDIVSDYLSKSYVNYTEVRARLLFSHWDGRNSSIDTEAVLGTFESNRSVFEGLFRRFPMPDNDLITVAKYKDTGAVYYAPRLEEIIQVLGERFRVTQIHFGPYVLSSYFPLIVAHLQ